MGKQIPIYNEADTSDLPPGIYIGLLHGRNQPDETLNDWGFNGPLIGPLQWFHETNGEAGRFSFDPEHTERADLYNLDPSEEQLEYENGLVVFGGKYYGDLSIVPVNIHK